MPRTSERIRFFTKVFCRRFKMRFFREFLDVEDEDEDDLDETLALALHLSESKRYHQSRKTYRKGRSFLIHDDLLDEDDSAWLNEVEFKQKYRMSRSSFRSIVSLIQDHPIFLVEEGMKGRKKPSVESQLLVLLKYLGTEGSGSSNPDLRNLFGLGRGTVQRYCNRALKAILSLRPSTITWPDEEERQQIARRILKNF